jgi:hypothetical protein
VTVSHKAALSLLLSVLSFAGFAVLAFTGLFDYIETRFYNPSVTRALRRETDQDAEVIGAFLGELQDRFAASLRDEAVRRSFLPNQSAEDIFARSRLYGILMESQSGLQSVRFIDAGGSRIHYSTYAPDILRQDSRSAAYRNYGASGGENPPAFLPYDRVAVPNQGNPKITPDRQGERLIFSHPFYDTMDVYRGTALFSLSVRAISERLVSARRIKIGEDISVIDEPPGLIFRLPRNGREILLQLIASIPDAYLRDITNLSPGDTDLKLSLIASKTGQDLFVGRLVDETLFLFPGAMKSILLASFFITVYLTIFLLFNLGQDPMTIVKNRIDTLRTTMIDEYCNRRETLDRSHWIRELEQRREEVRIEIKADIRPRPNKALEREIDAYIDTAWNELMAIIRNRTGITAARMDEAGLQEIVNRVLEAAAGRIAPRTETYPPVEVTRLINGGVKDYAETAEIPEDFDDTWPFEEEITDLESFEASEPGKVFETVDTKAVKDIQYIVDNIPERVKGAKAVKIPGKFAVPKEVGVMQKVTPNNEAPERAPWGTAAAGGEPEKPEDLEELGELEEIDEPEVQTAGQEKAEWPESPAGAPGDTKSEAPSLASQIEFSPLPEPETPAEEPLAELEIVSPFDTMLSQFMDDSEGDAELVEEYAGAEAGEDEKKNALMGKKHRRTDPPAARLEVIDNNYRMFLMSAPFTAASSGTPPLLETTQQGTIIEYRDGINYINQKVAEEKTDTEEPLNTEFKKLVESVLNGS